MPKFLSYQRPAPVKKTNWGGAPKTPFGAIRKAPSMPKPAQTPVLDVKLPGLKPGDKR